MSCCVRELVLVRLRMRIAIVESLVLGKNVVEDDMVKVMFDQREA